MRRIGLLAMCLCAFAAAACGSTALTTPIVGKSVQVNQDKVLTRQAEVPDMLADNSNPNRVYLSMLELVSGTYRFFISDDRGYTWTEGTAPSLPPYTNGDTISSSSVNWRTTMAQAPDGTLYLAYAARDVAAGGSRSVLLGRSTDRGNSWQVVAVDAAPAGTATHTPEYDFEPHVALDPSNPKHIVITWRRSFPRFNGVSGPATRAYIASSTDGGATFTSPAMIFDRTIGFDPPYPVFVNGALDVSWHETFSAPSGGSSPPDKIWLSTSTDGGKTFTDHLVTTANNVDTPLILYDSGRKKLDMFWDSGDSNLDVFYASSTDGGSTWTKPVRLNDDPENDGRDQELPAMAIAPNGRIDVAWYDYRNDPYPIPQNGDIGNRQDVYASTSFDGGLTWSRNVKINDLQIDRLKGVWNNEFFVQVPVAMANGNTWAVTAWSDTRNGDSQTSSQDIFAGPMAFDTSSIPAGQPGAVPPGYSGGDLALVAVIVGLAALMAGAGITLILLRTRVRARDEAPVG